MLHLLKCFAQVVAYALESGRLREEVLAYSLFAFRDVY